MTKRPIVVIGAGGHGRETAGIVLALPRVFTLLGFLDDGISNETMARLSRIGADFLGPVAGITNLDCCYTVGVGDPAERRRVADFVDSLGVEAATLIHPQALVGADVEISAGSIVAAGAQVTTNVRLGRHTHLNVKASVSHDCRVGDFVTISPGATICGSCDLADEVYVGAGSTIVQGKTVGTATTIGAGAVVVRDLPSGIVVKGVPAR